MYFKTTNVIVVKMTSVYDQHLQKKVCDDTRFLEQLSAAISLNGTLHEIFSSAQTKLSGSHRKTVHKTCGSADEDKKMKEKARNRRSRNKALGW